MNERRAWVATGIAAGSWGVSLWGPDPGVGLVVGALALGAAIRGTAADPARVACFAVGWQALALSWFPATWAAISGPGGVAATGFVVVASALPWIVGLGIASAALARGMPRGLALGAGLAVGTALADWGLIPIVPAELAVAGPGLAWPAAIGGREVFALALGAVAGFAWERPARASAAAFAWLATGLLWQGHDAAGVPLTVGVVESGVGAFEGRRPTASAAREARLLAAIRSVGAADLVVAPEGAWPGRPAALAAAWPGALVAGVDDRGENALIAFAGGVQRDRFAKMLLAPGSERRVFGFGRDRYVAGTGPRALVVPVGDRALRIAPLICYEDLFARASADARTADLVVAAANDGWNAPAAWAHLAAARLVAVETGRPVVRPTTSGISAVIDARGRLVWSTAAIDRDAWPVGVRAAIIAVTTPVDAGFPPVPVGAIAGIALAAWVSSRFSCCPSAG